MTSFTANPSTITDGDPFTLSWSAPCGYVSLAQKDQGPFITLQPSSGNYQLRPGQAGYPTASGATVYEAKNGDTATPLRTTVTMKPSGPPTVSVSASPSSCHPEKWDSKPCTVTCVANASSPAGSTLSYQWSGCASGAGSTGTCTFSQPGSADCTVTVTDSKGASATASKTVQGTNAAPGITGAQWYGASTICTYRNCWLLLTASDDDPQPSSSITSCSAVTVPGKESACTPVSCAPDMWLGGVERGMAVDVETGVSGLVCQMRVTLTDDWGASTVWTSPNYTIP